MEERENLLIEALQHDEDEANDLLELTHVKRKEKAKIILREAAELERVLKEAAQEERALDASRFAGVLK